MKPENDFGSLVRKAFETPSESMGTEGLKPDLVFGAPLNHKPIYPPAGVKREEFDQIIEATVMHFALSEGTYPGGENPSALEMTPQIVRGYFPRLRIDMITKVLASRPYNDTLLLRGLRKPGSDVLSTEQMRALSVMMDVSSTMSLERKLKRAGISWFKWQAWLHDSTFRAMHDKMASDLFNRVQADVDMQVASGALEGKLEFIKYFNEISGKHDPARRAHQDVQTILNGIVEIVTRNVTDPQVLSRISAELSAVVSKLG